MIVNVVSHTPPQLSTITSVGATTTVVAFYLQNFFLFVFSFLSLLAFHDWNDSALIIDFDNDISTEQRSQIQASYHTSYNGNFQSFSLAFRYPFERLVASLRHSSVLVALLCI
jgi:hypothetical protein